MSDRDFVGSIPELYHRYLGPVHFRPFAMELARRLAALPAERVLELAAGTGIVTAEAARVLPVTTAIVATDLNQAMLDLAARRLKAPNVVFQAADAQDLPFPDAGFDTVFCQFGVMFFPDRDRAYAETRRVLRAGGTFLFAVWDRIEANPIADAVADALAVCFPADPPRFQRNVPHGYHDPGAIRASLAGAGFARVTVETVTLPSSAPSARDIAVGYCQGTPVRYQITARDPDGLDRVTDAVAAALAGRFGTGEVRSTIQALIVTAA